MKQSKIEKRFLANIKKCETRINNIEKKRFSYKKLSVIYDGVEVNVKPTNEIKNKIVSDVISHHKKNILYFKGRLNESDEDKAKYWFVNLPFTHQVSCGVSVVDVIDFWRINKEKF